MSLSIASDSPNTASVDCSCLQVTRAFSHLQLNFSINRDAVLVLPTVLYNIEAPLLCGKVHCCGERWGPNRLPVVCLDVPFDDVRLLVVVPVSAVWSVIVAIIYRFLLF